MIQRDVVAWNSLILGYVENGESSIALDLFINMDCEPSSVTYVAALKACGGLARTKSDKQSCLRTGICIHKQLQAGGFDSDIVVATTLVDMYCKCGSMKLAREVFDRMKHRNVVSWSSLLLGYVANGESLIALDLFFRMDCQPNSVTYVAALKACAELASERGSQKQIWLDKGIQIHRRATATGFSSDIVVANSLIDMYSKCGSMQHAKEAFDRMISKDVVTWNSLILGHVQNGESLMAMDLFNCMDCEPDCFTFVAVLKACTSLASNKESDKRYYLNKGIAIHKQMTHTGVVWKSNLIVGNSLVDMYSKCGSMQSAKQDGENLMAMDLFATMDSQPDSLTYVAALKACTGLASDKELSFQKGVAIHKQVKETGYDSDIAVANTLVDMYSKCGRMNCAREVFDRMICRNAATWNSLILGYLRNGEGLIAMQLFTSMGCEEDELVDPVTYVAGLKVCGSLAGLPAGQRVHARVCKSGLEQDRVLANALMDYYGKCSSMSRAQELFNNMHSPDLVAWNSMISGYSSTGSSAQVFSMAKKMQQAGVEMDGITFVCILTACSHVGMVQEARLLFESMLLRYGVSWNVEHFNCMVDMLGRANRLDEALELIKKMPLKANVVTWMTLLGACRTWKNQEIGRIAYQAVLKTHTNEAAPFVLMSQA